MESVVQSSSSIGSKPSLMFPTEGATISTIKPSPKIVSEMLPAQSTAYALAKY